MDNFYSQIIHNFALRFYSIQNLVISLLRNGYRDAQISRDLRWPNTVCARFTDSVSDAIKRALGLW